MKFLHKQFPSGRHDAGHVSKMEMPVLNGRRCLCSLCSAWNILNIAFLKPGHHPSECLIEILPIRRSRPFKISPLMLPFSKGSQRVWIGYKAASGTNCSVLMTQAWISGEMLLSWWMGCKTPNCIQLVQSQQIPNCAFNSFSILPFTFSKTAGSSSREKRPLHQDPTPSSLPSPRQG